MNAKEILEELKANGNESIKKTLLKHGAKEPFYGVKVEYLKTVQKRIKKDYTLALELYDTGISDAMYLAGLIADDKKMTKEDLRNWAANATWSMISEHTVPWVASEGNFGHELAMEWMQSDKEGIVTSGWSTYSCLLALTPDDQLDKKEIKSLLKKIENEIHNAQNRVKQAMNGFVIAVGGYVPELSTMALETGKKIGTVTVDMGGTACKTPYSPDYIDKIIKRGALGKKKKTVKC
jgi:3-methyladenine DNA glycosylase AlkD